MLETQTPQADDCIQLRFCGFPEETLQMQVELESVALFDQQIVWQTKFD